MMKLFLFNQETGRNPHNSGISTKGINCQFNVSSGLGLGEFRELKNLTYHVWSNDCRQLIYIGTQGILQGTYETSELASAFDSLAEESFLPLVSAVGGAQPLLLK